MSPTSANLHFHGLSVPPLCHQDDVLKTSIQPDDPPFEYRFRIPADEAPGLYWYHPLSNGKRGQDAPRLRPARAAASVLQNHLKREISSIR